MSARNGGYCVYNLFLATSAVLKIEEYPRMEGNIRSLDVFTPIASERRYLMDYNVG